jgi:hypothetical protein
VLLSLNISPAHARVFIDGKPMPSSSFTARFARDESQHRIEIRAAGYVTKERVVSFADNAIYDLDLVPRPARRGSRRRTGKPPADSASPMMPSRRAIESRNPYAEDTAP